jgi:very-short-patch-repair endonuclease
MQVYRFDSARQSLLEARARSMRFNLPASEQRLWNAIRARQLGCAFRRQVPIGRRYIAGFYAPKPKLVVEVDGGWHAARRKADARRDEALRRLGYRVVRLEAELVMRDLRAAVARIAAELVVVAGSE